MKLGNGVSSFRKRGRVSTNKVCWQLIELVGMKSAKVICMSENAEVCCEDVKEKRIIKFPLSAFLSQRSLELLAMAPMNEEHSTQRRENLELRTDAS